MAYRFFLRRTLQGLLVGILVTITVFVATRLLTDPVKLVLPFGASEGAQQSLRHSLGLDQPTVTQLAEFFRHAVTFNFGTSIWQHVPVTGLVLSRLPATLELVLAGTGLAFVVFVPLGVVTALRPQSIAGRITRLLSLVGISAPAFWVGAMLIWLFAVHWHFLPTSGRGGLSHLVLPAVTLALTSGGRLALMASQSVASELRLPYVMAAYARGFSVRYVVVRHVLRNALIPVVTLTMFEFALNIAGAAVIIENVFAWPGIGLLLIQAVENNDVFLVEGAVFILALIVVATNLVTDVLYKIIDPRIELA